MASITESMTQKHPQQRLSSPSRNASALLHLAGLLSFANSVKYLFDNPNVINDSYGWHLQYLTILGLFLAIATFVFGILADVLLSPRLFAVKNAVSVVSTPMEVLISVLYWGIRAIDTRLVIPEGFELPLPADLGFHLAPAVFSLVDLLFFSPPYSIAALPAIGLSSAIALGYWFWIEICYQHNGWYPYPIFEALSPPYRGALFAGSALVMTMSTMALKWVYEQVNKPQKRQAKPGAVKR